MFASSLAVTFPVAPPRAVQMEPSTSDTVTWAPSKPSDTLGRGAALSHVLASRGFDSDQIREITHQLTIYRSPRTLPPGLTLRFSASEGALPDRIQIELNPDSTLNLVRSDSVWIPHVELVPFVMDTVRISGVIQSTLWSAKLGGDVDRFGKGEFEGLAYDLADVFAWKVDFTRDLRPGDVLRVALERKVRPDGSIRSRHFLAIELRNRDQVLRAFPQTRPDESFTYFDEEGRSLKGAFLRYPVPYRITSHFSARRFHPILKRWRAHEGIDYGAPAGAPVQATASGIVTRAGFMGGYGRLVELRHPQGIRTRYAHLSSIAQDVRPGAHVEQGQMIGRVGSSGLATGPHLHYEFLENGRHENPLTAHVPSAPSVVASRLADFYRERDAVLALLESVPMPYDRGVSIASGSGRTSGRGARASRSSPSAGIKSRARWSVPRPAEP
jgi:murein DD-endopeptidase MepM/ murein hydrolase activator NlpD